MKRAARFAATVAALLVLGALVGPVTADGAAAERVVPASVTVNQQFELRIEISNAQFGRVVETLPENFSYVTTDGGAVRCEPISGMPEGGVAGVITETGKAKFTFFASSSGASSFKYFVIAPDGAVTGAAFSGVLETGPEEQYDVGGQSTVDVVAGEADGSGDGESTTPNDGEPAAPADGEPAVASNGQGTFPSSVTGFAWYMVVVIVLAIAAVATVILVIVRRRRRY